MYFERDEGEEVVMLTRNVLAKKVIIEVTSGSSANRKHDKDDVNLRMKQKVGLIKLP